MWSDLSPERHPQAALFGAHRTAANIAAFEQADGWDLVIEATGSVSGFQDGLSAVRPAGRFHVFGVSSPESIARVSPYAIFAKELTSHRLPVATAHLRQSGTHPCRRRDQLRSADHRPHPARRQRSSRRRTTAAAAHRRRRRRRHVVVGTAAASGRRQIHRRPGGPLTRYVPVSVDVLASRPSVSRLLFTNRRAPVEFMSQSSGYVARFLMGATRERIAAARAASLRHKSGETALQLFAGRRTGRLDAAGAETQPVADARHLARVGLDLTLEG